MHIRCLERIENASENNTIYIVKSFRIKTEIWISCEEVFHLWIVKYLSSLSHFCEKTHYAKANKICTIYNAASSFRLRAESLHEMTERNHRRPTVTPLSTEFESYGPLWRIAYPPLGSTPETFQTKRNLPYQLS